MREDAPREGEVPPEPRPPIPLGDSACSPNPEAKNSKRNQKKRVIPEVLDRESQASVHIPKPSFLNRPMFNTNSLRFSSLRLKKFTTKNTEGTKKCQKEDGVKMLADNRDEWVRWGLSLILIFRRFPQIREYLGNEK